MYYSVEVGDGRHRVRGVHRSALGRLHSKNYAYTRHGRSNAFLSGKVWVEVEDTYVHQGVFHVLVQRASESA